jgi:hypothetical protein
VFAHNTIYLNESEYGGGLALLDLTKEDTLKITNSLIWNNKADYYPSICSNGNTEVTYSDIQGGWQGTGNIDKDPFFVNEEDGNFHLQMPSPCIDSGDPLSPKDPDGSISDIGAYYFNQEITPSIELYNRYDMFLRPFEQAYFDLWIYNLADTIATFDFWGFLISNEGKKIGPLSMKKNLQIKPENCLGKNHIPLSIPWNLPSGAYSIIGYIGKYPLSTDSSSFQIIKNDSENYIKSDRIPINPINLQYLY